MSGTLLIFSRPFNDNRAKTRIRKSERFEDSFVTKLHNAFLRDTIDAAQRVRSLRKKAILWAVESKEEVEKCSQFVDSDEFTHRAQRGREFGDRFENAFLEERESSEEEILIIGSDCPLLSPKLIEDALTETRNGNVVLGPAPLGGFYLLGIPPKLKVPPCKDLFQVGMESIAVAKAFSSRRELKLLPELTDIDTAEDLDTLYGYLKLHELSSGDSWLPENTASLLEKIY